MRISVNDQIECRTITDSVQSMQKYVCKTIKIEREQMTGKKYEKYKR